MSRETGFYRSTTFGDETVRAFVPHPLPPRQPQLQIDGRLLSARADANAALGKLAVAADTVPSADSFLYGFVRKEAVLTSQIEGTQATLQEVIEFEATRKAQRPADVQEVCNYVDALNFSRREIHRPKGLPLSTRLLCAAHKRLMPAVRGAEKMPGEIRDTQNWIGGMRPAIARFVPPPADDAKEALAELDKWIQPGSVAANPQSRVGTCSIRDDPSIFGRQWPHGPPVESAIAGALGAVAFANFVRERSAQAPTRRVLRLAVRCSDGGGAGKVGPNFFSSAFAGPPRTGSPVRSKSLPCWARTDSPLRGVQPQPSIPCGYSTIFRNNPSLRWPPH
jgi:hypothetical protein